MAPVLLLAGSLRPLAKRRVEIRFKRYSLVLQDSFKMSRDYLHTTPVPLDSSEEYEFLCPANISIRKQNRGEGSTFATGAAGGQCMAVAAEQRKDTGIYFQGLAACCFVFVAEKVCKGLYF